MLFYPAALPRSSPTPTYTASLIRRHRAPIGPPWRKPNPAQQALPVLACPRNGETSADLAAGFGIGTATAWRYVTQTAGLLAARSLRPRAALAQARRAGHAYLIIDGTSVPIDRVAADRPFHSGAGSPPARSRRRNRARPGNRRTAHRPVGFLPSNRRGKGRLGCPGHRHRVQRSPRGRHMNKPPRRLRANDLVHARASRASAPIDACTCTVHPPARQPATATACQSHVPVLGSLVTTRKRPTRAGACEP